MGSLGSPERRVRCGAYQWWPGLRAPLVAPRAPQPPTVRMSAAVVDSVDGTAEKKTEVVEKSLTENGTKPGSTETVEKADVAEPKSTEKVEKADVAEPKSTEKVEKADVAEPDKALLLSQFEAFSKFGDKAADGKTIKLSQSDKWFKQAGVIAPKGVSTTDTDIAFRKISKRSPKLSFVDWNKYLDEIAASKKLNVNEVKGKLVECGSPGTSGATKVVKCTAVDRLTDTSKYGGAHKQRFGSDGKGRGKEGREDAKSDGYVSGYKNKKGADEKMRQS